MASPETAAQASGSPAERQAAEASGNGPGKAAALALETLSIPARLEAILYLKGRPLTLAELARIAGIGAEEAELALITLMADYAHRDTALEIHQEGFDHKPRVLIVDDLLATGGTAAAAAALVRQAGGEPIGFAFVIELADLNGRANLPGELPVHSLIVYS